MTIWNIPELRQRTEAASKLPNGDLPEVGTFVHTYNQTSCVCRVDYRGFNVVPANGHTTWLSGDSTNWRYATPSEIDQFERDSALPDIVDPIEAEIAALTNEWIGGPSAPTVIRKAFLRGIEIERARKAGA